MNFKLWPEDSSAQIVIAIGFLVLCIGIAGHMFPQLSQVLK